jgi:hypothetical protein
MIHCHLKILNKLMNLLRISAYNLIYKFSIIIVKDLHIFTESKIFEIFIINYLFNLNILYFWFVILKYFLKS